MGRARIGAPAFHGLFPAELTEVNIVNAIRKECDVSCAKYAGWDAQLKRAHAATFPWHRLAVRDADTATWKEAGEGVMAVGATRGSKEK